MTVICTTKSQKFSATLPAASFNTLEKWRGRQGVNRSQALDMAVKLLIEKELKQEYATAWQEQKQVSADWDATLLDGLDANETW